MNGFAIHVRERGKELHDNLERQIYEAIVQWLVWETVDLLIVGSNPRSPAILPYVVTASKPRFDRGSGGSNPPGATKIYTNMSFNGGLPKLVKGAVC